MRRLLVLLMLLAVAVPAAAQQSGRVDADRLPIDIDRIARQLKTKSSEIREEREGLRLRYFLSVYGEAPAIRLFLREDNFKTGPVPHSAPTHQEFMDYWTPQEYRAPAMDFLSLAQWLGGQLSRKSPAR